MHVGAIPQLYWCTFFLNVPAPPEIYTLSLHDALPISAREAPLLGPAGDLDVPLIGRQRLVRVDEPRFVGDRKSTRLNSSHLGISYAVFCLKKKIKQNLRKSLDGNSRHHLCADTPGHVT